MIILSILIPTIPERFEMFSKLTSELFTQQSYMHTTHLTLGQIEVVIDGRESFLKGGPSIGKKRQALVERAKGKYLCFLDDDESIAPNYLEVLVRLCQQDADVCTFRNLSRLSNYWALIDMGLSNDNQQATPEGLVLRSPWHICPVKSEYAKLYEFEDTNYGEDFNWMEKVLTHCKTEAKSEAVVHCYNHGKHSESDKIMKNV